MSKGGWKIRLIGLSIPIRSLIASDDTIGAFQIPTSVSVIVSVRLTVRIMKPIIESFYQTIASITKEPILLLHRFFVVA